MSEPLTDAQKHDLACVIQSAWKRYTENFGEDPHGTLPQLKALVELMSLADLLTGIRNKAVAKFYAEGQ